MAVDNFFYQTTSRRLTGQCRGARKLETYRLEIARSEMKQKAGKGVVGQDRKPNCLQKLDHHKCHIVLLRGVPLKDAELINDCLLNSIRGLAGVFPNYFAQTI